MLGGDDEIPAPAFAGINFCGNDKGGKGNDWGEEL